MLKHGSTIGAVTAITVLALAGCSSGHSTAAGTTATTSGTGSSATTGSNCSASATTGDVKVGLLYPATGPLGAEFSYVLAGATARFDYAASQGGPKVTLDPGDTMGDPTRNLQQAQRMVSNGDFAIIEDDTGDAGSGAYLHAHDIPVVGFPLEPVWAQDDNMFGFSGAPELPSSPPASQPAQTMINLGASNLAIISISGSEAAAASAQSFKTAFLALGGKSAVIDSVQFGQQQFTADVQLLKNDNVNSIVFDTDAATGLNFYVAAKQAGLNFNVALELNGYSPATLSSYGAKVAGVYFSNAFAPLEAASQIPAVQTYINAMHQYEPSVSAAQTHAEYGWVSADLILQGLKDDGECLSDAKFISALTADTTWDADGIAHSVKFSDRTQPQGCDFFLKVNSAGTAFLPQFNDQPQCSHGVTG